MFFIYASMIEFIIVNYLHRQIHQSPLRPESADRSSETFRATLAGQIAVRINGNGFCIVSEIGFKYGL